jgi:hypothetical protein
LESNITSAARLLLVVTNLFVALANPVFDTESFVLTPGRNYAL